MARQTLAQEITQYLTEQGAVRVGFADLHGVTGAALPYGITALVALPREIVGPLADQPHRAYYDAYQAINVRLDARRRAVPPCCGPMAIRPRPTRRSICPPALRIALLCLTRRWPAGRDWAGSGKITS